MSIESRLQPDEININSLSLEQPDVNAGLKFNPEKDIRPEDKQQIFQELERLRKLSVPAFCMMAAKVKILFPNDYAATGIGKTEFDASFGSWVIRKNSAEFNRNNYSSWQNLLNFTADLKLISPEKMDFLESDDVFFQEMKDEVLISGTDTNSKAQDYLNMLILYPEKTNKVAAPPELWNKLIDQIAFCRKDKMFGSDLAYSFLWAKLLFPARASEIVVEDSDWQLMKTELKEQAKRKFIHDLASMGMVMKLLAMENLQITKNGFEFSIPDRSLSAPAPDVPKVKRF